MYVQKPARAFSLIEVVIAIALFASTVTVILALLPGLSRQGVETADRLAAQRLPDAIRAELARSASADFDSFAGSVPVMGTPLAGGYALVATRNGARVGSRDAGSVAEDERYYSVECWRFPDAPLRYSSGDHSLALLVRVSWPYPALATGTPAEFMFVTAINR